MLPNRWLGFAAASLCAMSYLAAPIVAGVIDQQHSPTPYKYGAAIYNGHARAQTFTVGLTGVLDRIELQISSPQPPTAPLQITFRNVLSNGLFYTTAAQVSLDGVTLPTDPFTSVYTGIDLGSAAFEVSAGDVLAIVLSSTTQSTPHWYSWTTSQSNGTPPAPQYLGGQAYSATSQAGPWASVPNEDGGFRTFVTVPEPGTLALAGAALAMFGVRAIKRSRRNR